MIYMLALLGCAVLFWPSKKTEKTIFDLSAIELAPPAPRVLTFQEAIASLSVVRKRLEATGQLSGEQETAIDALTLALVRGSGKE